MKSSDKSKIVTAVKIYDHDNDLYMKRGGGWNDQGSVWNSVGHAKLALHNAYGSRLPHQPLNKETEKLLARIEILETKFQLVPSEHTEVHRLNLEKIKNTGSFA